MVGEPVGEKLPIFVPNEDVLYLSSESEHAPLMLLLDTDIPYVISVDATIAFINPRSQHIIEAISYLEYCVDNYSPTSKIQFFTYEDTPIINDDYDTNVENWQTIITTYEESLLEADEDEVREIQAEIEYYKTRLDRQEIYRYSVSADMITEYKKLVEYAFIPNNNILYAPNANSDEFFTLLNRYVDNQLTLDQLIIEGNKMLLVMQKEAR